LKLCFYARAGVVACALILSSAFQVHTQADLQVGYSVVIPEMGAAAAGSSLFSFTNSAGVLVSEAGVGSAEMIVSGRIFVDEAATTRTGIALVNRSTEAANITLVLRDGAGNEFGRRTVQLGAGQHTSKFVDELQLLTNPPSTFTGSLTFESNRPLAAVTLRVTQSGYGEPLYTTLPVVNLRAPAADGVVVLPHIAAGGGYATQFVLINPGSRAVRGRVHLFDSDGLPLLLRQQGTTLVDFPYDIPPDGSYRTELDGFSDVRVGYGVIEPESGSPAPVGSAIFRFAPGGRLVTEAGVGAIRSTTAARTFVDYIGTRTGVAIVNRGDLTASLTFILTDRNGVVIETNSSQTLLPRSHLAKLVDELFPSVTDGFSGVLEIRSSTAIVPITLKLTTNGRNDLVLTTLPVADLTIAESNGPFVFPHIVLGGGFTTRVILLNASATEAGGGSLMFFKPDGTPMVAPTGGGSGSQFKYSIAAGGGRRFYPGNAATPASVSLIDRSSNQLTNEIVVNEGNAVPLRLLVRDSTGAPRDDFDVNVASLDPAIAAVNKSSGSIEGRKAGFSTLTIGVGGVLKLATATVVKVDNGGRGYEVAGVVQDSARRLYLASTDAHAILRAENLSQTPQVYAGVAGSPGLVNDVRLQSLFRNPAFLALNHLEGSLYVSDGANHSIRRVGARPDEKVTTLAGTGVAGNSSGPAGESTFNNPQGLALDGRGNLWVADSGNHTIRRINLATRTVETIAGQTGTADLADGQGEQARFRSPAGIAVETETAVQQLERFRSGGAPPPVTVLVADTGNGLIRRVKENGEVETVRTESGSASTRANVEAFGTIKLVSPFGVAVDAAGNIYVTEPESGRVRVILRTGEVVSAAQAGTIESPRGIVAAQNGRVVVAGRDRAVRELVYGEPQIASVTPATVRKGQRVTLKGTNFAPDSLVVLAGVVIQDRTIENTQTITFTTPDLSSGLSTLTVQNRGGLGQASILVDAVPLRELRAGYITTVAGGSTYTGEGGSARAATLNPTGLAVDPNGNVFVADTENRRVRRIDRRTGTITTVAGTGDPNAPLGDGGPAIAADLNAPAGVLFDPSGNLLIAEAGRVRKVDARTGVISTLVGGGPYGYCNDKPIDALQACFAYITGFAMDGEGNLYIGDYYNNRVSRVDARTNIMTTIAGNGGAGYSGDNGDARNATLSGTYGIAVDDTRKRLYIAGNGRVRKVDLDTNRITTVVGGGTRHGAGTDGGSALEVAFNPIGLAIDVSGNLFIADSGDRVRKFDPVTEIITTAAGGGSPADGVGDGGPAVAATFDRTWCVAVDGAGNLFIGDSAPRGIHYLVRKVDAATQIITSIAGNGQRTTLGDNNAAIAATLRGPNGLTVDSSGNLFITDPGNNRIRRVDASTREITTVAGGGTRIETGVPATDFYFYGVEGRVAIDEAGNLYIAEGAIFRVRKVDARTKLISTVAGNGSAEFSGDGGLAINAGVRPSDLAVDGHGNLYIAERGRVRKVDLSGMITTVAGGGRPASGIGDGGLAVDAVLGNENDIRIVLDADGNLFISDPGNKRVRRVDAESRIITTVAGGGVNPCCENQLATAVDVFPEAVGLDPAGNLLIVDWSWPPQIRRVNLSSRSITIVAGGSKPNPNLGDNGPATDANLHYPYAVTSDAAGNIFIADSGNSRIRAVRGPIP
jgi:sugar lactone lactonase YvrE